MELLEFNTRNKTSLALFGAEIILMNILFWIALVIEDIQLENVSEGLIVLLFTLRKAVIIALVGCMLFLFLVGVFTDITMKESVPLVFVGPVISIISFVFTLHFLFGIQNLVEATINAIFGSMAFVASGLPILLIIPILFGTSVRDRMASGTAGVTVQRFLIKARTFILVGLITLVITLIYQLNHIFFPEKDAGFVLGESILFIAIVLALVEIPLNEKLIISVGASFIAIISVIILGMPLAPMVPMILIAPAAVYLTNALELDLSNMKPVPTITAIAILAPLFVLSYFLPYIFSDQAIFFTVLGIGVASGLVAIRLNLQVEEGMIVGSVLTLGLIAGLLVEDLLPRYEQLIAADNKPTNNVIGHLFLPFFALIVVSIFLGLLFRQNVLCIANDGHRLSNRGERILDDWMTKHGLAHEVHPVVDNDSTSVSFLVKNRTKEYYVQYWPEVQGIKEIARQQEFQKEIKEKNLDVDFVDGLGSLDNRLEYILKGETLATRSSNSYNEIQEKVSTTEKQGPQKDISTFEGFWKRNDNHPTS
jgi:hypothetical protein